MALQVELVAADRQVWAGEASSVSARSVDGDLGILPGHTPTLVVLTEGEIRIHRTEGGVASATVEGDRVTIVTDAVEQPSGV